MSFDRVSPVNPDFDPSVNTSNPLVKEGELPVINGEDQSQEMSMTPTQTPVLALKELVARLYREQNKVQNLLSSLGYALRSFNNLNQFLEITPLMASRVSDAEGGALILYRSSKQIRLEHIHCQEGYGCHDIKRSIEELIRQLTYHSDDRQDITALATILDQKMQERLGSIVQLFSTPILVKNNERGRLYIFSSDPGYRWTPTRRRLVQLVADQTAVAIANNELTLELRQKERQDRELEIASEIQNHLLPTGCPDIQGLEISAQYRTANRIGGDYYDFIPANYDQIRSNPESSLNVPWSIVIGDVMGKGVPAGLIMTMTRGMLRAEILNRHSPAQILEHLNRVMYSDLENSHRFVTLFYSEYNPINRTLAYSNAAHHPPLLWKAQQDHIYRLDTAGMLIGLDIESSYEDAEIQLAPHDTLLYYTDGLTDAVNQQGERFDEENLYKLFQWACQNYDQPQQILNYLFQEVQDFVGDNNQNLDDMTLVVFRVKPS